VNAHSCGAGPVLERVSQCVFQLAKAEKAGALIPRLLAPFIGVGWESELRSAESRFQPRRNSEAIHSLPALAGRAADPQRPHPCGVANSVAVLRELSWLTGGMGQG
jgi:hypothetical protein